jgi:hypothetical protein
MVHDTQLQEQRVESTKILKASCLPATDFEMLHSYKLPMAGDATSFYPESLPFADGFTSFNLRNWIVS